MSCEIKCPTTVKTQKVGIFETIDCDIVAHGPVHITFPPLPNLPKQALIIPCYHCQVHHFQILVKYRPLRTLLLAPNSHHLPLHFKLDEVHFLFHSVPQTTSSVFGSSLSGTSSQTFLQSFALSLAQILVTNLQLLGFFIPDLDNPTLIVVSKPPLPTETLASL